MPPSRPLEERFWEKVKKQPGDGCWEWTAYRNHAGYGVIGLSGKKSAMAHRVSWFLEYGEWPRPWPKYTIDHLCQNTSCVRPDHLEDVTHNENVARSDKTKAGAALRTGRCSRGHDDWYIRHDGRKQCRPCARILENKQRADPEKLEKRRATARAYYRANSEKLKAKQREYNRANREKKNAAARAYYRANSKELAAKARAYRARKRAEKEGAA